MLVFFQIKNISDLNKKVIEDLLEKGKTQITLVYLKGIAPDSGGVHILKEHAKSWDMIPNPALDPYWSGSEEDLVSTKLLTDNRCKV